MKEDIATRFQERVGKRGTRFRVARRGIDSFWKTSSCLELLVLGVGLVSKKAGQTKGVSGMVMCGCSGVKCL